MSELQLKIVSLQKLVYNDYVDSVTLPTKSGEITVLPNHAPLISHLAKGTIRAKSAGQQKPSGLLHLHERHSSLPQSAEGGYHIEIDGGFMEVSSDSRLTVLLS